VKQGEGGDRETEKKEEKAEEIEGGDSRSYQWLPT
jgi:hypothetical protein